MILNFHLWSIIGFLKSSDPHVYCNYILDEIKSARDVTTVNILAPEEIHIHHTDIVEYCQLQNIKLTLLFGATSNEHYKQINLHSPKDNRFVKVWPIFFFRHTIKNILIVFANNKLTKLKICNTNFTYPILCMIARSSDERRILMDWMEKYNLIKNNAISWHGYEDIDDYPWQHWTPKILKLTDIEDDWKFSNHSFNQFILPYEYYTSFLQIVPETSTLIPFITEKTVIPLLYKKVFISIGSQNFYKELTKFGFVLYDEIIDYSFDKEQDYHIRVDMILSQVARLVKDPSKFNNIYEMLRPKLEYNQKKALELAYKSINTSSAFNYLNLMTSSQTKKYFLLTNSEINLFTQVINKE